MSDEINQPLDPEPTGEHAEAPPDEPASEPAGGWEAAGDGRSAQAREWLAQLQQMIDRVAAEAAPVARDVAAKAAELAAVAGEKAGPLARRAAEVTEDVGTKVAERSRRFAEEVRHRGAEGGVPPSDAPEGPGASPAPAPDEADAPPPAEPQA